MDIPGHGNDPLWYKDAIIYELHVRAFRDGNGDGIGDFPGLMQKLDYLQDLGVTALWLLPFYPSPLKDDGYDIADYMGVHPAYGTLDDFVAFVEEAHHRGLRVIAELVLNHTSDEHPWFRRARTSPAGSVERDYYIWSGTPDRYSAARVIFQDYEQSNWAWDPVAGEYYWHRFYAHQPDLNYDNPVVRAAMIEVIDFWMGLGVDGLRLDAVPYLFEREGTNCENLPETHAYLKQLRSHIDTRFPGRMLLAEANQWPEDAIAYFGGGDECHMAFHFPLMPRLFMAIRTEDRFPVLDILAQTPAIPESGQWALFLRNHDELTLEMVTEEERLYMYRVYAESPETRINLGIRRRLAPLLHNDRRRIELMNALLLSLPGTPVLYYGDEIGMGDNPYLGDRDGVRTPMQWSADRNAGFSDGHPHRLYLPLVVDYEYHSGSIHVEAQVANPSSLLSFTKRLITLRKRHPAFARGAMDLLDVHNDSVLAFVRSYGEETVLVVANLSRFVQQITLDLAAYPGLVLTEMFSRAELRSEADQAQSLVLSPHAFHWFVLEPQPTERDRVTEAVLPTLAVRAHWEELVLGDARVELEAVLPAYLAQRRWFGGKGRNVLLARIVGTIKVPHGNVSAYLVLVRVEYAVGESETYTLPLACRPEDSAEPLARGAERAIIASVLLQGEGSTDRWVLYDAFGDQDFVDALLQVVTRGSLQGGAGSTTMVRTSAFRRVTESTVEALESAEAQVEGSNTVVRYGDRLVLKLYRRLEMGPNPDVELGRFLTERGFAHIPPLAGAVEYRQDRTEPVTLAIVQGFMPNKGNGWDRTLEHLDGYFRRVLASGAPPHVKSAGAEALLSLATEEPPPLAKELIGPYLNTFRLLGRRTADLHAALSSDTEDPNFNPEPATALYRRSRYQSQRSLIGRAFRSLRRSMATLPEATRTEALELLEFEDRALDRFRTQSVRPSTATRIRCHGNYHLGQVLFTADDIAIIDFEGEPARHLSERRLKCLSLSDIASMLRSLRYVAHAAVSTHGPDAHSGSSLERWARFWRLWVSAAFLGEYLHTARGVPGLLPSESGLAALLDTLLLEVVIYELGYELNTRPEWAHIPVRDALECLRTETSAATDASMATVRGPVDVGNLSVDGLRP